MRPAPENDGSEHQQAVYMLRRVLTDAGLSLKRHSYFQISDLWERPYAKANEVLTKPAAQGILHGITYAPKESYHAICRVANILSGKITPLEAYFGISVNDEKKFGRENISALRRICLKKNGGQLYAWYLPTDIEAERGIVSKLRATFETLEDVRNIDDPVVIDTYTGEVFKPEAEYGRGTADSAAREISLDVPVAEYPFVLCDAKDIRFDAD